MSRSYSPDEMATLSRPSRANRWENEPGLHRARGRSRTGPQAAVQKTSLARHERQRHRKPEARAVEPRKPYEYRNRTYALRSSEIQTDD